MTMHRFESLTAWLSAQCYWAISLLTGATPGTTALPAAGDPGGLFMDDVEAAANGHLFQVDGDDGGFGCYQ